MRSSRARRAVLAATLPLAFVFAVGACSQGPNQTPAQTGGGGATAAGPGATGPAATSAGGGSVSLPAACDLLTRDDFVQVIGLEATKAGESNLITAYTTNCEWTFPGVTIVIGLISPGGADFFELTVEYEGGQAVDGLGDQAVRTDSSGTLLVLEGDTVLDLQSIGAGDDVDRVLVERILARLE